MSYILQKTTYSPPEHRWCSAPSLSKKGGGKTDLSGLGVSIKYNNKLLLFTQIINSSINDF